MGLGWGGSESMYEEFKILGWGGVEWGGVRVGLSQLYEDLKILNTIIAKTETRHLKGKYVAKGSFRKTCSTPC